MRRQSVSVRQIPTRRRLVRVFQRKYLRQGHLYSGCIRFEHLRERFGSAVLSVIEDLIKDGLLEERNCGALAYELVLCERIRLGDKRKPATFSRNDKLSLRPHEVDLEDLGPQPTLEARCTAVSMEVIFSSPGKEQIATSGPPTEKAASFSVSDEPHNKEQLVVNIPAESQTVEKIMDSVVSTHLS